MTQFLLENKEWIFSGAGFAAISAFVFILKRFFSSKQKEANNSKQIQVRNNNIQAGGDVNIQIDISEEQLEAALKNQEQALMKAIALSNSPQERHRLEEELKAAQQKLSNIENTLAEEKKLRQEAEKNLQLLKDELPETKIQNALKSLQEDIDTKTAEKTFDEVVEKGAGPIALAAWQSGKLAENRIDYSKAMKQFNTAATLDGNNFEYLLKAAQLSKRIAEFNQAKIWLDKLQVILKKDKMSIKYAIVQHELADLYFSQGKYEKAEHFFLRALKIKGNKLGIDHPQVATSLNSLAMLYKAQGKYEKALPLYERCIEILHKTFPNGHKYIDIAEKNYKLLKLEMKKGVRKK